MRAVCVVFGPSVVLMQLGCEEDTKSNMGV